MSCGGHLEQAIQNIISSWCFKWSGSKGFIVIFVWEQACSYMIAHFSWCWKEKYISMWVCVERLEYKAASGNSPTCWHETFNKVLRCVLAMDQRWRLPDHWDKNLHIQPSCLLKHTQKRQKHTFHCTFQQCWCFPDVLHLHCNCQRQCMNWSGWGRPEWTKSSASAGVGVRDDTDQGPWRRLEVHRKMVSSSLRSAVCQGELRLRIEGVTAEQLRCG